MLKASQFAGLFLLQAGCCLLLIVWNSPTAPVASIQWQLRTYGFNSIFSLVA